VTTAISFRRLLCEAAQNCILRADLWRFFTHVPAFSATVVAIMMLQTANIGPGGRHSGRFGDASGVERGVETGTLHSDTKSKKFNFNDQIALSISIHSLLFLKVF
jgi:hypothetical protein